VVEFKTTLVLNPSYIKNHKGSFKYMTTLMLLFYDHQIKKLCELLLCTV